MTNSSYLFCLGGDPQPCGNGELRLPGTATTKTCDRRQTGKCMISIERRRMVAAVVGAVTRPAFVHPTVTIDVPSGQNRITCRSVRHERKITH
ncbi:hypothetical protein EVAR_91717_1 [Eumeta japonica]|uniref:Uncharacterized protein n=1 Tax=Eumeta variegata TaxID=151549 RepID=A0A4C1Z7Z2_EUMVA|nr:hypothetical protein EVAR_91717_1 [Eumeta japonica]